MGLIRIFALLAVSVYSLAQGRKDSLILGGTLRRVSHSTSIDYGINKHADSLNFWRKGTPFPDYLQDTLFDFKMYRRFYPEVVSYRRMIINRVTNEKALWAIVKSKNKFYDYIYDPMKLMKWQLRDSLHMYQDDFINIPYQELSWRNLAKERLKSISFNKSTIPSRGRKKPD